MYIYYFKCNNICGLYIYIVYYKIRHEAKTAYSQNTIKSLKHTCTL